MPLIPSFTQSPLTPSALAHWPLHCSLNKQQILPPRELQLLPLPRMLSLRYSLTKFLSSLKYQLLPEVKIIMGTLPQMSMCPVHPHLGPRMPNSPFFAMPFFTFLSTYHLTYYISYSFIIVIVCSVYLWTEFRSLRAGIFVRFVHCSISRTQNRAWHGMAQSNAQLLDEYM